MHLAKLQLQIGGKRSCIAPPHQLFMSYPVAVLGGPPCSESTYQIYPSELRFPCNTHLSLACRCVPSCVLPRETHVSVTCDIKIMRSKILIENFSSMVNSLSYNERTFSFCNFFNKQIFVMQKITVR